MAALAFSSLACERRKAPAAAPPAPAAAPAAPSDRIVLGHVASLTGAQATFGVSIDRGIRLAVNEQNARGGVKGRVVEVKTLDDQGSADDAATAAARLVNEERALVLLGEAVSERSLAMAPVADANETPMISPSSTSPLVTKDGEKTRPYVFRVCFTDAVQGAALARFARETLGLQRVAILREEGSADSSGLARSFAQKLEELGGTRVADEAYAPGAKDFRAPLEAVKARDPQALFVPGYYAEAALVARQARELGMRQPLLGGDGWDSAKLLETGGRAVDGSWFATQYAPDDPTPAVKGFVHRFRQVWGEAPDGHAAAGYDAARVALDALARAAELRGPAVKDAIAATKAFPGVTGAITLDADHGAQKAVVILTVKGGATRHAAALKP